MALVALARRSVVVLVVLGAVALGLPPAVAADDDLVLYVQPVDAPVVDPFRPPTTPFGPGNRGLEYDTTPGSEVRVAARGTVEFAGPVAGALHVTVRHPDGRRTTYSFLRTVAVSAGQRIESTGVVGTTGEVLHVSVREGERYVDPAGLFGTEVVAVRLLAEDPSGSEPWQRVSSEAQALAALVLAERRGGGLVGRLLDEVVDHAGDVGGALWDGARDLGPALLEVALVVGRELVFAVDPPLAIVVFDMLVPLALGREAPLVDALLELDPLDVVTRVVERSVAWWAQRAECTPESVAPPRPRGGRRVAVLVGGLGSTSDDAAVNDVDTAALGYARADVLAFSYAGGRTPGGAGGELSSIDARPYGAHDAATDLTRRGELLADLLEQTAAATPGATIDVYAHSQGGVVLRLALAELVRRRGGPATLARLGLVATMGTPHQGADLATMALVAAGTGEGQIGLALAEEATDLPVDPDRSENLVDLARGSELIDALDASGLPAGPQYLSIAARGDWIVTAPRTRLEGAREVIVPVSGAGAHWDLPGDPATTREVGLALAGLAPTCESFADFVRDLTETELHHAATVRVAAAVALATSFSQVPEEVGAAVLP